MEEEKSVYMRGGWGASLKGLRFAFGMFVDVKPNPLNMMSSSEQFSVRHSATIWVMQ